MASLLGALPEQRDGVRDVTIQRGGWGGGVGQAANRANFRSGVT